MSAIHKTDSHASTALLGSADGKDDLKLPPRSLAELPSGSLVADSDMDVHRPPCAAKACREADFPNSCTARVERDDLRLKPPLLEGSHDTADGATNLLIPGLLLSGGPDSGANVCAEGLPGGCVGGTGAYHHDPGTGSRTTLEPQTDCNADDEYEPETEGGGYGSANSLECAASKFCRRVADQPASDMHKESSCGSEVETGGGRETAESSSTEFTEQLHVQLARNKRMPTWDVHIHSALVNEKRLEKAFTRFQAILTDLPKHALASKEAQVISLNCQCPGSRRGGALCGEDRLTTAGVLEVALVQSSQKYPVFAGDLARLQVAYAGMDVAIFVDHERRAVFTSLRGTSLSCPRDLGNDCLVALGCTSLRLAYVKEIYINIRTQYPGYTSYGCGHSLGGTVMHELACSVEIEPLLAFERVDVFNAGGSPFRRGFSALDRTEFNAHRVAGDLVSYFYRPPGGMSGTRGGRVIQHTKKPDLFAHGLGHFLPDVRRLTVQRIAQHVGLSRFLAAFCACCGGGRSRSLN